MFGNYEIQVHLTWRVLSKSIVEVNDKLFLLATSQQLRLIAANPV